VIYSRFDDQSGMYDLFEDGEGRAINSDLPVPVMGAAINGIGVPASVAGRPIPSGAKFIGKSWHARGMVAAPGEVVSGLSGETDAEGKAVLFALAALGAMGLFLYFWYNPAEKPVARSRYR
jgi:hypothetical protein